MTDRESLPAKVAGEISSTFVPGTGPLVERIFVAVRSEWGRNRSLALKVAIKVSGLSREDLAERIENEPEVVPLLTRLLWEAAMTGQSHLLEAMGAAFGAAVGDLDRVNEYELILGGLRNLHGDDVRVLRKIRDRYVFDQRSEEEEPSGVQTVRQIGRRLGRTDEAVAFGLVRLVSQGFATSLGVLGGVRYESTELGRLLYDALERMDES
ncbi:hypothetical protein [Kribbella sp. CA-293567]|uniref:hypothetical protein n=1 Tax=Kribbella sp. CA-293567 TaxID=3002436 RepID=UPI0022DD7F2E|nr:hypothetical protein [Kribbella sp. CA-293567]WBQ03232.1 hypothetical protein OX958_25005 [Kribbella sp. CA-293567]